MGSEEDKGIIIYLGTCGKTLIRKTCTNSVQNTQEFFPGLNRTCIGGKHPIPTATGLPAAAGILMPVSFPTSHWERAVPD